MKRRRYSDGEQDRLQRVVQENKKLKGQISQLRKQMSRIDVDRFQNLKDLLDAQDREEQEEAAVKREQTMERDWRCWQCPSGTLRLTVLERRDGVFYYRKCDGCPKKTRLQPYSNKVKEGPK